MRKFINVHFIKLIEIKFDAHLPEMWSKTRCMINMAKL